jgi:serine/threonine protein kinase
VNGGVDNPIYKAPELIRSEDVGKRIDELTSDTVKQVTKSFMDRMREVLPNGPKRDDLLVALSRNVFSTPINDIEAQGRNDKSMLFFDRTVDVWGLGSSALEMLTGRGIGQEMSFLSQIGEMVGEYGANRNNRPLSDPDKDGNPQPGSIGLKTGNAQIDDLLTRMLMPDPRDRSTTTQLLSHPALNGAGGVDSKEARDLIVALKSGDPQKIALARQALGGLVPPPTDAPPPPPLPQDNLVLTMDEVKDLTSGSNKPLPPLPPLPQTSTPGTGKSGGEDDEKVSV